MTPRPNASTTNTQSEERPTSAAPAAGSRARTPSHQAPAPDPAPAPVPAPNDGPALPFTAPPTCPKCGGRMWDNRASKRNPKAPDFKCRNRSCDGVVWPGHHTAAVPIFPPRMHEEGREVSHGSEGSAPTRPQTSTAQTPHTADAANRPRTTRAAAAADTAPTRQAHVVPIPPPQRRSQPSADDVARDSESTAALPSYHIPPVAPDRAPSAIERTTERTLERAADRAPGYLGTHPTDHARAINTDRTREEGKGERGIPTTSIPPHTARPPLAAPLSRCDAYRNYLAVTEFVLAHVRPLYRDARIPCTDATVAAIVATLFTATRCAATEPQPTHESNPPRHPEQHQQGGDRR